MKLAYPCYLPSLGPSGKGFTNSALSAKQQAPAALGATAEAD